MKIIDNVMRDSSAVGICTPEATELVRKAVSRWHSYTPTPLLSLDPLARQLRVDGIWLKYEGSRFGLGSFKGLGTAYALTSLMARRDADARAKDNANSLTVSCASDGNYGRAVAWAAQQIGCDSVVYLPRHVTPFREQAIRSYGARTVRVKGNYNDAEVAVKNASIEQDWTLVSDASDHNYEAIPRDVMLGYSVMMSEIAEQIPLSSFTHVFLQCGVGAFAGAVCDYLHCSLGPKTPTLVTVEPLRAACILASVARKQWTIVDGTLSTTMVGLSCGRPSPLAWQVLQRRVDFCTALHDSWALAAVRSLASGTASGEPVVAGETGAAGLGALLCAAADERYRRRLRLNAGSRVLLFCTEGATDPIVYGKITGRSQMDFS